MTTDRDRYNLLYKSDNSRPDDLITQEITPEVFKTDKLYISTLPADFQFTVTLDYRKKLTSEWIKTLPSLNNVKKLTVRHRVETAYFEAICQMKNLECLTFITSSVENISSIQKLKNLKRLELHYFSKLTDIKPILFLKNLEVLVIENCFKVSNYEIIGQLTNLMALGIHGDLIAPRDLRLNTLKPFSSLKKLRHLDLSVTRVIDESYETLLEMENLIRFDVTNSIKKDIREKIKKHPNLISGFFLDWDWENNKLHKGKVW